MDDSHEKGDSMGKPIPPPFSPQLSKGSINKHQAIFNLPSPPPLPPPSHFKGERCLFGGGGGGGGERERERERGGYSELLITQTMVNIF